MPAQADLELASRDPQVPGLALCLDSAALRDLVAGESHCDLAPSAVRVEYVRYKPGTSLVAGLLIDTPTGLVRGYAVAGNPSFAAKLAKLTGLERRGATGHLASDPARRVAVARLEADPRLPGVRAGLPRIARQIPEGTADRLEIVRYRPFRRLVAVVEDGGRPVAALRMLASHSIEGHMSRSRAVHEAGLPVPRPLGRSRRHGLLTSTFANGVAPTDGSGDPAVQVAAGTLLAHWHGVHLGRGAFPGHDQARAVGNSARLTALLLPASATLVDRTATRVQSQLSDDRMPPALVHGDFSVDQLLRDGDRTVVVDLDRLRHDEPAWDLATWYAAEVVAGRCPADAEPAQVLDPLLGAYRSAGGGDPRRRLPLLCAAALLQRAPEPFRTRRPQWAEEVEALVAAAARLSRGAA